MDNNADANDIVTGSLPEDWQRPLGCHRITSMRTVLDDLECHKLTLTEAENMAQNWPLYSDSCF